MPLRWSTRGSRTRGGGSRGRSTCLPGDYVLVIAEKPRAARKIVEALAGRGAQKCSVRGGAPYWVFVKDGSTYVVASAVGHLFGLYTEKRGFPVFDYVWRPLWEVEKGAAYTRPYYRTLEVLGRRARLYINACDFDIEGSVIGFLVIKHFGDVRRAKRVKFSSLTREELRAAFSRLMPLDIEMVEAGLARHELDWIWGVNVSRALMESVRVVTRKRVILSAGRVQSPTLVEAAKRDLSRRLFVPLPRFTVKASLQLDNETKIPVTVATFEIEKEARVLADRLRRNPWGTVKEFKERELQLPPPYPFNLPDLQAEAARLFGFSPYYTQRVAEELYLEGLISYPRTNSQRLPPSLDLHSILRGLSRSPSYRGLIETLIDMVHGRLVPRNGPKEDPAHPAIHPTGELPSAQLSGAKAKLYDLIVKRFLATLAPSATYLLLEATISVERVDITLRGKQLVREAWLLLYKPYFVFRVKPLPRLKPGQRIPLTEIRVRREYTKPPQPYTRIKLVKWMESAGIGTESTRARIVELLFKRGYLEQTGGGIAVTDLGLAVVDILQQYFTDLTSIELTRTFEKLIEDIRFSRTTRTKVIQDAMQLLQRKLEEYKTSYMREAGLRLAESLGLLEPASRCLVCRRRAERGHLCSLHAKALDSIREAYREWSRRLGGLRPESFIEAVARNRATGRLVKELIEGGRGLVLSELWALASEDPSEKA